MLDMYKDITLKAHDIMEKGTILADIAFTKDKSRIVLVDIHGDVYFLRFMDGYCYALGTVDDMRKMPIRTDYRCEYTVHEETEYMTWDKTNVLCSGDILSCVISDAKGMCRKKGKVYIIANGDSPVAVAAPTGLSYVLSDFLTDYIVDTLRNIPTIEMQNKGVVKITTEGSTFILSSKARHYPIGKEYCLDICNIIKLVHKEYDRIRDITGDYSNMGNIDIDCIAYLPNSLYKEDKQYAFIRRLSNNKIRVVVQ